MTTDQMNGMERNEGPDACDEILDLASRGVALALSARFRHRVEAHVERCRRCAAEIAFMQRVHRARPMPPAGLAHSVLARLEDEGVRMLDGWRSASMAAAAVLVLSMGVGLATQSLDSDGSGPAWNYAFVDGDVEWVSDDWLVAGAPYLEEVSEETLLALLSDEDF